MRSDLWSDRQRMVEKAFEKKAICRIIVKEFEVAFWAPQHSLLCAGVSVRLRLWHLEYTRLEKGR